MVQRLGDAITADEHLSAPLFTSNSAYVRIAGKPSSAAVADIGFPQRPAHHGARLHAVRRRITDIATAITAFPSCPQVG